MYYNRKALLLLSVLKQYDIPGILNGLPLCTHYPKAQLLLTDYMSHLPADPNPKYIMHASNWYPAK